MDDVLAMLGMESCKPTSTLMVRKESAANGDEEMLDVFQETPFRLASRGKLSGSGEFFIDQGSHEKSETSFALHSRNARHASGVGSALRTVDGNGWLV